MFTPDDCLVVGGHFYTSAHIPRTLEGLSLQEHNPDISNESLESKHYDDLTRIFRTFHELGTPDEVKRAWANCQMLLQSRPKPKLPESRSEFIRTLREFSKIVDDRYREEPE